MIIMIWLDYDYYDFVGFSVPPSQHADRGWSFIALIMIFLIILQLK